jgi:hypothetical protein
MEINIYPSEWGAKSTLGSCSPKQAQALCLKRLETGICTTVGEPCVSGETPGCQPSTSFGRWWRRNNLPEGFQSINPEKITITFGPSLGGRG